MRYARPSLVAATVLLAATAAGAQDRMPGSGIRVTKEVSPRPSATPGGTDLSVVSGGDIASLTPFSLSAYANMIEPNITAHMASADSLEIEVSRLAATKATSQSVRDFANMLVTDHTAHLAKTWEIITDEDVGATPLAFDPEVTRLRQITAQLRSQAAGPSWDAAFLRFQIAHHQNEIDMLQANIKVARDDDLEEHIEDSLDSLAKHRDAARAIAVQLGVAP